MSGCEKSFSSFSYAYYCNACTAKQDLIIRKRKLLKIFLVYTIDILSKRVGEIKLPSFYLSLTFFKICLAYLDLSCINQTI